MNTSAEKSTIFHRSGENGMARLDEQPGLALVEFDIPGEGSTWATTADAGQLARWLETGRARVVAHS